MVMTLLLCDDGRLLISDSDPLDASLAEESDQMTWRAENGAAYFEESVMTLTEDGSLCVEEEGVKIYFLREKRDPQPEENAAAPAGCASAEY